MEPVRKDIDFELFKRKLLEIKFNVLEELGYFEEVSLNKSQKESSGDISAYTFHMADLGTDAMEREKAFHFSDSESRLLSRIDKALLRIEDGTFGICQNCNKNIGIERLEAVPHARFCLDCKTQMEEDKKRKEF